MHQVHVRYSEALARAAVRAFYWRTLSRGLGLLGLLGFAMSLANLGFLILAGDRSWLVGFVGATLFFLLLLVPVGYIIHYRNAVRRYRRMTNPQAQFMFADSDLSIASELGSATLLWDAVREVWAFPRFWLILLSRSSFLTLPTEGVGEDVLAFVRSKTRVS
jgi:hypothetical protein